MLWLAGEARPNRAFLFFSLAAVVLMVWGFWCVAVRGECVGVGLTTLPGRVPEKVWRDLVASHTRLVGEDATRSLPSLPRRHNRVRFSSCTDAVWVFVDDDYGGWFQPSFCQGSGRRERCPTL